MSETGRRQRSGLRSKSTARLSHPRTRYSLSHVKNLQRSVEYPSPPPASITDLNTIQLSPDNHHLCIWIQVLNAFVVHHNPTRETPLSGKTPSPLGERTKALDTGANTIRVSTKTALTAPRSPAQAHPPQSRKMVWSVSASPIVRCSNHSSLIIAVTRVVRHNKAYPVRPTRHSGTCYLLPPRKPSEARGYPVCSKDSIEHVTAVPNIASP